mmetsp:Transcript_9696/g.58721  ORF Transcript_9696/g.58721 Transcript_9696/m.58721 type:complete len:208 (+) Transcript_9696:6340-6963(+)
MPDPTSNTSNSPLFVPQTACLPPGTKRELRMYPDSIVRRQDPVCGFQNFTLECEHVMSTESSSDKLTERMSARCPAMSIVCNFSHVSFTSSHSSIWLFWSATATLNRRILSTFDHDCGQNAKPFALCFRRSGGSISYSSSTVISADVSEAAERESFFKSCFAVSAFFCASSTSTLEASLLICLEIFSLLLFCFLLSFLVSSLLLRAL